MSHSTMGTRALSPLLLCLVLTLAVQHVSAACSDKSIELASSILLFVDTDYKFNCHQMLRKIASNGGKRVNFIPTHWWVDMDDDNNVDYFAYRMGDGMFRKANVKLINSFRLGMQYCFQAAIDMGFDYIMVTPHLDDATPPTVKGHPRWRNYLPLDPFNLANNEFSYIDILIDPLIAGLSACNGISSSTQIAFNIQGEMNQCLVTHPGQWTKLMAYTKQSLQAGGAGRAKLTVGINNNWNVMCGLCKVYTTPDPGYDTAALGKLYGAADFVAVSAYAPVDDVYTALTITHLERAIDAIADELKNWNIDLKAMHAKGLKVHYAEFGLGGGGCDGGPCPSANPKAVASMPYFGIGAKFNKQVNPWANAENVKFVRYYYDVAMKFAENGGGTKWSISSMFVWSYASYDFQGIYPESTNRGGSYMDTVLIQTVANFNKGCAGRRSASS